MSKAKGQNQDRSLPSDTDVLRRIHQKNRSADIRLNQFTESLILDKRNILSSLSRDQRWIERKVEVLRQAKCRAMEQYLVLRKVGEDCEACRMEVARLRKVGVLGKEPSIIERRALSMSAGDQRTITTSVPRCRKQCFVTKVKTAEKKQQAEDLRMQDVKVNDVETDSDQEDSKPASDSKQGKCNRKIGQPGSIITMLKLQSQDSTPAIHACGRTSFQLPKIFGRKKDGLKPRPKTTAGSHPTAKELGEDMLHTSRSAVCRSVVDANEYVEENDKTALQRPKSVSPIKSPRSPFTNMRRMTFSDNPKQISYDLNENSEEYTRTNSVPKSPRATPNSPGFIKRALSASFVPNCVKSPRLDLPKSSKVKVNRHQGNRSRCLSERTDASVLEDDVFDGEQNSADITRNHTSRSTQIVRFDMNQNHTDVQS